VKGEAWRMNGIWQMEGGTINTLSAWQGAIKIKPLPPCRGKVGIGVEFQPFVRFHPHLNPPLNGEEVEYNTFPLAGGRLGWGSNFSYWQDFTPNSLLPFDREYVEFGDRF